MLKAGPDVELTNSYLIPGLNLSYTLGQASLILFAALVIITLSSKSIPDLAQDPPVFAHSVHFGRPAPL